MTGFGPFLRKETLEIRRTWRIWVLPGLLLFFAVTSPVLALLTPALVSQLVGSQPGVVIQLPDPVPVDSYLQFMKNLDQLVLLAVIIAGAGIISSERNSGTAALVLTKPLSRAEFVLAKVVSQQGLLIVATAVSAAVCIGMTTLLFGTSPIRGFVEAVALWTVYAMVFVVLMAFLSAVFASTGGAAGVGLGVYIIALILRIWPPAIEGTLVGLPAAAVGALGGQETALGMPLLTASVAAAALLGATIWVFSRAEIP